MRFFLNLKVLQLLVHHSPEEDSPIRELKSTILSIDWEITDEIMTKLTEQIGRSRDAYKNDKAIVLFLQLLDSVGKYIKTNKANTHPDAIKLLNSVYTSLEKVALSKGISSAEKEKTLLFEVKRFKKLKEKMVKELKEDKDMQDFTYEITDVSDEKDGVVTVTVKLTPKDGEPDEQKFPLKKTGAVWKVDPMAMSGMD